MVEPRLVAVVVLAVITMAMLKGAGSRRTSLLTPQPNQLAPFNWARAFFSLSVVFYHCTLLIAPMKSVTGFSAEAQMSASWAFRAHPMYCSVATAGQLSVDIFFAVSGFFTSLSIHRAGAQVCLTRAIVSRFLRLWFLILVPLLWGLLRGDPGFLGEDGSLSKFRFAGWFWMFGNYLPYIEVGPWFMILSIGPCWYLVAEFQCSVLLFIFVPLVFRGCGHAIWPYACLIAAFATFSAVWVPLTVKTECMRPFFELIFKGAGMDQLCGLMGSDTTRQFLNEMYGWAATPVVSVPDLCGSARYPAGAMQGAAYVQSHFRFVSSLVGAAFGAQYHRSTTVECSTDSRFGSCYFGLALVLSYAFFCPQNMNSMVTAETVPTLLSLVVSSQITGILASLCWLFVIYCALMPSGHRFHAPRAAKVYGSQLLNPLAMLSPWIYVLHFPIGFEVLRYLPPAPVSWAAGMRLFALVLPITIVLAMLCQRFLEPGFAALQSLALHGGAAAKARDLKHPLLAP